MPEVENSEYLIEYLLEIGTSMASGFGVTPLTWTEIYSWQQLMSIELTGWELTQIMTLSRVFSANYAKFDEKDFPTPYTVEEFDREAASQGIGNALRSLASRVNKR